MTMDHQSKPHEALRRRAKDWVVHVATGEATQADLEALERWRFQSPLHAEAYAQACRLWGMLGSPLETAARSKDIAKDLVKHLPEHLRPAAPPRTMTRPMGRRAFLGGAVAAPAAPAAGIMVARPPLDLWPSLNEIVADYRTGVGEQRKIALAERASIE